MPGASANRGALAFKEEATPGVQATGDYSRVRLVDEGLKRNVGSITSNELRADRQVADTIQTEDSGSGPFNTEMSYGAFDPLFEGALYSADWSSDAIVESATKTISSNVVATTGNWSNFAVGDMVRFEASGAGANRGLIGRVQAIDGANMTIDYVNSTTGNLTDIGSATAFDVRRLEFVQIGVQETGRTYSMEQQRLDRSLYTPYVQSQIDTMGLSIGAREIVTMSWGIVAAKPGSTSGTSIAGTPTTLGNNPVMSFKNCSIFVNGALQTLATQFDFNLANNVEARNVIGPMIGAESIRLGEAAVTGSMSALFADATNINLYENQTEFPLALVLQDSLNTNSNGGNAYVFDMPQCKFTDGSAPNPGKNSDVPNELTFQAILGAGTRTLRIWRIPV